jgi:hypothetical protein
VGGCRSCCTFRLAASAAASQLEQPHLLLAHSTSVRPPQRSHIGRSRGSNG